jgi:hypothetical protein
MSITLPTTPVALDREFAPISEQELEGGWRRAIARMSGRVRRWHQLTQRAVVILGESGSGKTAEIAMRAAALRALGGTFASQCVFWRFLRRRWASHSYMTEVSRNVDDERLLHTTIACFLSTSRRTPLHEPFQIRSCRKSSSEIAPILRR